MHCYLYVRCKTPDCPGKLNLAHLELPLEDNFTYVDYPNEWFPVLVSCGACGQAHSYAVKEVRTETAREPHHPDSWKPLFGEPPVKPRDTN